MKLGGLGVLTIILLTLVLIDCRDDFGETKKSVLGASVLKYVADEGFLASVGG